MARTVVYTRKAARALARMPADIEALIRAKFDQLARDPASLGNNVKAMRGVPGYRLRVGDWRALFTSEDERIIVHDVGPRGSIYG
ncbi:mRNA interferase RelE/StbE [Methylobacterium sp. 174MFSha1.1]|uniref:type II toxin-antitoxin system RelE family toxin n=1 Tax=Methylobacterium sp. 174MFSha1.1 TaxID=1502749 RepID=UPI0008F0D92F|nr:type II toxin-antitoxin system RelE/ParE family toxin [Methylobacterium sp. 174MFSha1.1]SFV03733.1 mRNA interferase RelE/StbE [Methylobacterium sp. 174MFSha1.1]